MSTSPLNISLTLPSRQDVLSVQSTSADSTTTASLPHSQSSLTIDAVSILSHSFLSAMSTSKSIRINPLSVAKGHKHTCELCSKTATLLCSSCRVTFYCSSSHLQTDAAGIHTKICSLLGALRSLRPSLGSEDERQKRQLTIAMSHHALIDLCQHEAHKWAIKGRYDLCIPGALQALRFSLEVYGKSRIELVPAYLLLAEGNLGLGRLKSAEEFLLYANWAVLQSTTPCPPSTQSLLHRQFGALYVKQGRWDAARTAYAKDIYHSSLEFGPEHIDTSVGIYHLGLTHLHSQPTPNIEAALAFFDKVVDIWYRFLLHIRSHPAEQISDYLLDHQIASSCANLLHILTVRHRQLGKRHIATAEAAYVLGLLKIAGGWDVDGYWLLERAEGVYEEVLGRDNESTQGIRRAREEMGEVRVQRGERMKDWETEEDSDSPSPKTNTQHLDRPPQSSHEEQKEQMEKSPSTSHPAPAFNTETAAPVAEVAAAQEVEVGGVKVGEVDKADATVDGGEGRAKDGGMADTPPPSLPVDEFSAASVTGPGSQEETTTGRENDDSTFTTVTAPPPEAVKESTGLQERAAGPLEEVEVGADTGELKASAVVVKGVESEGVEGESGGAKVEEEEKEAEKTSTEGGSELETSTVSPRSSSKSQSESTISLSSIQATSEE